MFPLRGTYRITGTGSTVYIAVWNTCSSREHMIGTSQVCLSTYLCPIRLSVASNLLSDKLGPTSLAHRNNCSCSVYSY
eukprot:SAG31_NODE_359_length_17032_cov_11.017894_8_plen_78_part_00